jgi:hypothetical protein
VTRELFSPTSFATAQAAGRRQAHQTDLIAWFDIASSPLGDRVDVLSDLVPHHGFTIGSDIVAT